MTARAAGFAAAIICTASIALPGPAEQRYIDGLFVAVNRTTRVELIAYAESNAHGQLLMQMGSLEDAPTVHELFRVLSSIPFWKPSGVFVTTSRILSDSLAERRQLVFAVKPLNVYALEMRIGELERREKIDLLLESVKASYDTPGYAFIVIVSEGNYRRYYPIRLTPEER